MQLINTTDGYHIWSEVYDSELEDIFEVQDEIATKIVNRLKENFAVNEKKEDVVKPPTENIDAYNLYLKGRYYWNKSNPEDILRAIKTFEEAIQHRSNFCLALLFSFLLLFFSWIVRYYAAGRSISKSKRLYIKSD